MTSFAKLYQGYNQRSWPSQKKKKYNGIHKLNENLSISYLYFYIRKK